MCHNVVYGSNPPLLLQTGDSIALGLCTAPSHLYFVGRKLLSTDGELSQDQTHPLFSRLRSFPLADNAGLGLAVA